MCLSTYLVHGTPDGGSYTRLGGPYGSMAGMMVWDINSDKNAGIPWATAMGNAGLNGQAGGGTTSTSSSAATSSAASSSSSSGGTIANGVHTLTPLCATGSRLDDNAAGTTNGTKIQIWAANSSQAQNWNFTSVGTNTYNIAVNLGPYCIDGGAVTQGTQLQIWGCNGTADQGWVAGAAAQSGNYNFALKQNGLCMDVNGAGNANGTKVQTWACNGGTAQAWAVHLVPCAHHQKISDKPPQGFQPWADRLPGNYRYICKQQ